MIKSVFYAIKSALYATIGFAAISSMALSAPRVRVTIEKTFLRRRPRCLPGHSRRQRTPTHGKLRTR
jgi:hypothetical protein